MRVRHNYLASRYAAQSILVSSLVAVGCLVVMSVHRAAFAAPGDITALISQQDGTPDWSPSDGAGFDSGPSNGIVRTNDIVTYNVEVRTQPAQTDVTFELTLPVGMELGAVPEFCGDGSSLTPATLPAPVPHVTLHSYQDLPAQTLVCNVGNRTPSSSFTYPVPARVRPEVPNTTVLTLGTAVAYSSEDPTPIVATGASPVTVSARAQFDLSKNGVAATANTGYVASPPNVMCADDPGRVCMVRTYPVLLSAPAGGKGVTPLAGPITFIDDLSPESFFPAGYDSDSDWSAAGASALQKYGARLVGCSAHSYMQPAPKITPGTPADRAVRDSGTWTCLQTGGPGTPVSISIADADTTAYTYPSEVISPAGTALPADKAYVIAGAITIQLPVDAVMDLGTQSTISTGQSYVFATNNQLKDFAPAGLDGVSNVETDTTNNSRTHGFTASNIGSASKSFVGVPGYPGNIAPGAFNPSNGLWEGLPGADHRLSGNISAMATQPVLSNMYLLINAPVTPSPVSVMLCDSWDNTKLWLKADNYQASSVSGQHFASGGAAVWQSGGITNGLHTQWPSVIEYSGGAPGGQGAASACDGTTGWHSDPLAVSGNDPAKVADNVYTGVTRVRIYTQVPYYTAYQIGSFSIGQVIADNPGALGDYVPNYMSSKFDFSGASREDMLDSVTYPWTLSGYNPDTHAGFGSGDRLMIVENTARITKRIKKSSDASYGTSIVSSTGGGFLDFQLSPSLTAPVNAGVSDDVTIEDCLPNGLVYVLGSASVAPRLVQATVPGDAHITCPSGATYLRWELSGVVVNSVIPPITFRAEVSRTANPGTYTNTALIYAPGDRASTLAQRTSSAQAQIVQPSGVQISKTTLTPLVQLNRSDATTRDDLSWRIELASINMVSIVSDVDIIDVLPRHGVQGSHFGGTNDFASVTVTEGSTVGQPVTVLYASDVSVNPDPHHASNVSGTATTTWCTAASGGTAVVGSGTCPTGPSSVTALRFQRAGQFVSGERISAVVSTTPVGNRAGDVYVNRTAAAMGGLLTVGPDDAPAAITGSSVGNYVWLDANKDGVQDPDERGIEGVRVNLIGTDHLGNTVNVTAVTGTNGQYTFDGIRAGNYRVVVDPSTLPMGVVSVYSLGGGTVHPANDSLVFSLAANARRDDVDFGYYGHVPAGEVPTPGLPSTGVQSNRTIEVLLAIVGVIAISYVLYRLSRKLA